MANTLATTSSKNDKGSLKLPLSYVMSTVRDTMSIRDPSLGSPCPQG